MFVCLFSSRIWSTCGFWAGTVWFMLGISGAQLCLASSKFVVFIAHINQKVSNVKTISQIILQPCLKTNNIKMHHISTATELPMFTILSFKLFSLKIALRSYSPGTCQWGPWKENIISCQVVCQLNYWTRNGQLSLNYSTWLASRELHTVQC